LQAVVWCEAMRIGHQGFNVKIRNRSNGDHPTLARRWLEWGTRALVAFALLLALAAGLQAQAVKRLILTDGSYQPATEWKQEGDRVKYFSAERNDWEELPSALVDWKATDAWNAQAAKVPDDELKDGELKQVTGEEVAERKQEMLNTPQVEPKLAPELRLPPQGGVFLLEERAGKPLLQEVQGSKVEENDHDAANRLKKAIIPLAGQTQTFELKGAQAKVRLHTPEPGIFVDVENDQGPIAGDNFRIVRLERKHEARVLSTNKSGLTGQSLKEAFLHSRAEKFSGDWWKLIPLEDLAPGEYAIVIQDAPDEQSSVVWDFGVNK
jgi:hypothetical protein